MRSKTLRQNTILDLIENNDISTQEELCALLKKEGFDATQATVSRDIRELSLTKIPSDKTGQKYSRLSSGLGVMEEKYRGVLNDGFVGIEKAESILVLKTVSGMAMAVGAAIDAMHLSGVAGCIAGDDTVMIAVKDASRADELIGKIRGVTGE